MALDYIHVEYPEPHIGRTKALLKKYPDLRKLMGNTPSTFLHILFLVSSQIVLAYLLKDSPFWLNLLVSFAVGAVFNHALFVMIHECTHNLVFKGSVGNRWAGIVANLPIVFPSAMGFRTYHLIHHRYQGELDKDADLSGPIEAKLVGRSTIRKVLWLLFFFVVEGVVRPARLKGIQLWDRWVVANLVVELAFLAAIYALWGWGALIYLSLSTVFSVGLHPLGARWIQEHYVVKQGQETYSYYGPAKWITYNVGYHNEHHDLMTVPWSRLPQLRAAAPEFYDTLYSHQSWSRLLLQFLFSPDLTLYSRVVRPSRSAKTVSSPALDATTEPASV